MDDLTPWEEINPPMALAARQGPLCVSLEPASDTVFRNELAACLSLVAPVGMTEEAKADWLLVAWETLKHLPADMLHKGCVAARSTCDHPSKIVPAIIAETRDWFEARSHRFDPAPVNVGLLPSPPKHIADRDRRNFTAADWAELNVWLEKQGAKARYRPDGTRYMID